MKPERLLNADPAVGAAPPFEKKANQFAEQEAQYAQVKPRLLVAGDSLGRMWGEADLAPLKLEPIAKLSISGDMTQHILWRIENSAVDLSDLQVAIVIAGSNNLSAGDKAPDIFRGVLAVVAAIRAKAPNARIAVLQVPPRFARAHYSQAEHEALNRLIVDDAEQNGYTAVPHPPMDPNDAGIYKDGVHLFRTGYRLLTTAVAQALGISE